VKDHCYLLEQLSCQKALFYSTTQLPVSTVQPTFFLHFVQLAAIRYYPVEPSALTLKTRATNLD
jgi:hypothetical protein